MKHILILLFCFLSSQQMEAGPYTLAIAAIFKDEAPYLKEWIEYHKLVGVERECPGSS